MALTYQSEKNVTLSRRDGDNLIKLLPGTVGTQVALTARNGVTKANVQEELEAVHTRMDELLTEADAMQYKGVVNADGDIPTTYSKGWMWKVGTDGTYKGAACEKGDTIIANVDRDGTGNTDNDFDILQGNVVRPVSGPETSVADCLPVFEDATGMKLKDSGVTLDDLKQAASVAGKTWTQHVATLPDALPEDLADGGLLFVDA